LSWVLVLTLLGVAGALIDLSLHVLQLWPHLEPSRKFTSWLTMASGAMIAGSTIVAFNWAALLMGLTVIALSIASLVTGKEMH